MSVHRIKIESLSVAATVVHPTWSGKTEATREDGAVFFREKMSGDFTFIKTDYTTIKNVPDCERIEIYLEEYCDGTWAEAWRGSFTTYDVKFNESACIATVKPTLADRYECLLKEATQEIEFADVELVSVKGIIGTYVAGQQCCTETINQDDPTPTDPVCDVPAFYCFDKNHRTELPLSPFSVITSCFHRITATGTATEPPPYGDGWEKIFDTTWWRCPVPGESFFGRMNRGRFFANVLDHMGVNGACPIIVRSHFFNINATHAAPPDNIAYQYATEHLSLMTMHQKSDVKRPDATNPAQDFVFKVSWAKLLEDLRSIFNVYWLINDDGDMIIEHLSYFEATVGLNITAKNIVLEYGKGEESAPTEERFQWVDQAGFSTEHAGQPITYGNCGNGINTVAVNLFSTDIFYIKQVENQAEISDQGFCLVANIEVDGTYYVKDYNYPLGWEMLHDNLHLHGRPFAEGFVNGVETTFLSVRPSRKLAPFNVDVCCYDEFNPEDKILTSIGEVEVDKVTTNYFAGKDTRTLTIDSRI